MFVTRHNGTSGNYASTPDNAAFSALGDFSVLYLGTLDDWSPAGNQAFMSHFLASGNQRSWIFQHAGGGNLRLSLSTSGSAVTDYDCTSAHGFTDGTVHWIMATRASSSGDIKFYTASYVPGSVTPPAIGSFSQLGTTVAGMTGTLFNSTNSLLVGAVGTGTASLLTGNVHRVLLYTGIYGSGSESLVRDYSPSDASSSSSTSWTAGTTGETWTLNGTVPIWTYIFPSTVTATGAANTAAGSVQPNAGTATGTGTANNAAISTGPSPTQASATGVGLDAGHSVSNSSTAATASGAANTAAGSVAFSPSTAAGTAEGGQATHSIAPTGEMASAIGVANDATISTSSDVSVNGETATAIGAASTASAIVAPSPSSSMATGVAGDAAGAVEFSPSAANGTAEAGLATFSISPTGDVATALGVALDATISTAAPPAPPTVGSGRPANPRAFADRELLRLHMEHLRRDDEDLLVLI